MVCKKCGTEFQEGIFCPECGMKNEEVITNTKNQMENSQNKQKNEFIPSNLVRKQKHNISGNMPKKILIMLGIAILSVIAVIIIVNWEGDVDYVATVKAHTPFAVSQGLPYTYEDVLTKYFDSLEWEVHKDSDIHYVDISGTVKEMESKFSITIKVSSNPDDADSVIIEPVSISLGDRQSSAKSEVARVLYNLFCMYDEGYEIPKFNDINEVTLQDEIELTETFNDEDTGISFLYPAGWIVLDLSSEFHIVEMIDSQNTPDHIATFNVNMIFDSDPYGVFTQDKESVRESVSEYFTFLDFEDTLLGDVPAKVLKYQTEGLNGDNIVMTFWYMIGEDAYKITCSCTASTVDTYEPIFYAMMDTYTINTPMPIDHNIDGNVAAVDIHFNDIPIPELLNFSAVDLVQQFGSGYYTNGTGGIFYDEIEFYMLDDETVGYVCSYYPECFSINGNSLYANSKGVIYSDEIIELLGSDYEDEFLSSGYYITYHYPTYTLSFGINKFNEVSDIRVYNLVGEWRETSSYFSDDTSLGYQESIEKYWKLAGFYSDGMNMSTLSLSIYTSQEEGEIEIGTAEIYANNGQYYLGAVIPMEDKVYKVVTDTGEEVLLIESASDDVVALQLYVDGQYLDEYWMTRHYES